MTEGRQRFADAHKTLSPYLHLQGRKPKALETGAERGRAAAATEALAELVADAPTYWQAAWLLGKAKEALGDVEGALSALRAAHARHPHAEPIARDFGMLLLQRDEIREACEVNRTICAAKPTAENLCNLAVTELLGGDLDAAEKSLAKSLALDAKDPIAQTVRSRIAKYRAGAKLPRTMRELERGG